MNDSDTKPRIAPVSLRVRCCSRLDSVPAQEWDALDHGASPFLKWGFLRALECSGSIGGDSGWHPFYLLVETADSQSPRLVGGLAAFVKLHSYGEYIFDWMWAGAAERARIAYYPKLVISAPMTPATGRRLLVSPDFDARPVCDLLASAVRELADDAQCSSVHWLFVTEEEHGFLSQSGFAPRASYQFHWRNRGYKCFDDFLSGLRSRKRKTFRKERMRAYDGVEAIDFVPGGGLGAGDLDTLDHLYRNNAETHGAIAYLRPGFFHALAQFLPQHVRFARAANGGETVAGALYLETDLALYGRYWGCKQSVPYLHFELAYYAGMERCIRQGTPLFEAGAQGEHKLVRGFSPARTYSNHWIRDSRLHDAVCGFLEQEALEVERHMMHLGEFSPYK